VSSSCLTAIEREVRDYQKEALKMDTHEAGGVRDWSDSFRKSNWTGCLQAAGYQKMRSGDIKVKVKSLGTFTAAIW
jgi:hypothetical protein